MSRKSVPKKNAVSNEHLTVLRKRVATAPAEPGIYRWLDTEGKVLYVGKAKNLRQRLRSYVTKDTAAGPWKRSFLTQIADFEVTVTNSELEALIFETNLIKELRPKYNVLMKDDKNYIYARVTVKDPFPSVETARRIGDDPSSPSGLRRAGGAQYFGPIVSGGELWAMITMLRSIFPFRTCTMEIATKDSKETKETKESKEGSERIPIDVECRHKDRSTPCLDHHIEKCCAPCIGTRTSQQYKEECIDGVIRFLKGDYESVRPLFEERMKKAAMDRKFELAAQFRDYLNALDRLQGKQLITDTSGEDSDVIAVAVLVGRADVVLMHRRNGRLIGDTSYSLAGQAENAAEVLEQFLPQYYGNDREIPESIIVSEALEGVKVFEEWLTAKKWGGLPTEAQPNDKNALLRQGYGGRPPLRGGRKVRIILPQRGKKSHLLQLAEKNVQEKSKQRELKWEAEQRNTEAALKELQKVLKLSELPQRIEGYDISHLGGTETVGSMVVARGGKAASDQYRSFTIRSLKSGEVDDYKALQEVLKRRLRHLTGGLKQELNDWKKKGVEIRRARKADQFGIKVLVSTNPQMGTDDLEQGIFFVAVRKKKVIGCCRIYEYSTGLKELRSMCIAEGERGQRLGQLLLSTLLSRVKRGKIYAIMNPNLEQYYAEICFRHILKIPPILEKDIEKFRRKHPEWNLSMVMMFDSSQNKIDPSLASCPDLLVIDGGKGQLGATLEVLKELKLRIPMIGLAKREEEVFVPDKNVPITFPKDSPAKFLLMRLRDEAHRFANRHREKRGAKAATGSVLDSIPGIGPETRKQLLQKFGSVASVREASDDQLLEILSETQFKALRRGL